MLIGYVLAGTGGQTPAAQVDALTRHGVDVIHVETGSGKPLAGRPVITAVLDRLEAGDGLVVTRLDRLARSLPQLVELLERLRSRGAHLISLAEDLATQTARGAHLFHVAGIFSEFERTLRIERSQTGLGAKRPRGTRGGRKPLKADVVRAIQRVAQDKTLQVEEFCKEHQISRTTFYKYQAIALEESAARASRRAELSPRGPTRPIPMLPNAQGNTVHASRKATRSGTR